MGANTKIEWTDHTFNPWRGCSKVHTGCLNCYAEKNYSVKMHGVKWGPNGTRVKTANWEEPRKWNRQAACCCRKGPLDPQHEAGCPQRNRPRVFCASLADVFEDWQGPILNHNGERLYRGAGAYSARKFRMTGKRRFPASMNDLRRDLFRLIDATPNLDWLLLTKRPENVERMCPDMDCEHCGEVTCGVHRAGVLDRRYRPNVWLGCSVSDQATADAMIRKLIKCRDLAPVLFVSAEPLMGPIDLSPYLGRWFFECDKCGCNGEANEHPGSLCGCEPPEGYEDEGECDGRLQVTRERGIDWVIVGGESGPHARPCNLRWIRSIRDQCKAAGAPCFIKQLGACLDEPLFRCPVCGYVDIMDGFDVLGADEANLFCPQCHNESLMDEITLRDKKGGDWDEWPEDLRVRELPCI